MVLLRQGDKPRARNGVQRINIGIISRTSIGVITGDTRSLDNGSYCIYTYSPPTRRRAPPYPR